MRNIARECFSVENGFVMYINYLRQVFEWFLARPRQVAPLHNQNIQKTNYAILRMR